MISKEQVLKAQEEWGQGVVKTGTLKTDRKNCEQFIVEFIDKYYAFNISTVLFKPTKASLVQFRTDKEGAKSYFIGGNSKYPEDHGFAIHPWTKVRFENSNIILDENRAFAMGNYYFMDMKGEETKAEYTFGYKLVNGDLKIDIHHSSLPFNPNI
ncbi:MAG: hypothetical protein PHW83_00530 [Bacteroidales bacterium]|nr:hypothetical protein [Bacteroidales bacterium]